MHINIKAMLAMIKDEPEDKYIPVLKPVLEALLNENKMLRRKNSQLGGKVARMRRALNGGAGDGRDLRYQILKGG